MGVLPGDPSQRDEDRAEVREEEHGPRKARHAAPLEAGKGRKRSPGASRRISGPTRQAVP